MDAAAEIEKIGVAEEEAAELFELRVVLQESFQSCAGCA